MKQEEDNSETNSISKRKLSIFASADPTNPSGRAGVVIALHKGYIDTKQAEPEVIVPGRALLVKTRWRNGAPLTVLSIYAPNVTPTNADESAAFFNRVQQYFEDRPRTRKPDLMLGDFNIVEEPMDRLPARADPEKGVLALDDCLRSLRLSDGSRNTYPSSKNWTHTTPTNTFLRLDRIYATEKVQEKAREWEIQPNPLENTDHKVVSVMITDENAPAVGKGHRNFPTRMMQDKLTMDNGVCQ